MILLSYKALGSFVSRVYLTYIITMSQQEYVSRYDDTMQGGGFLFVGITHGANYSTYTVQFPPTSDPNPHCQ